MAPLPLWRLLLTLYSLVLSAWANTPLIYITTSLTGFDEWFVEGWSGGGKHIYKISNNSSYPFSREFGGGDRSTLKGTQIFGSGYPYGNDDTTTIAGRPLPYGLWPIYWNDNIMGSAEYGPALDGLRPGGQLVTIPLKTQTRYYNVTEDETYYLIGDRDSVLYMMISLVTSCHVAPAWPSKFNPSSLNSSVAIESVVQYYRASSFALVFPGYNNTIAVRNSDTESQNSTPLPDLVVYSTFKRCIDDVIVDALPILIQPSGAYTLDEILWWLFGIWILPALYCICCGTMLALRRVTRAAKDAGDRVRGTSRRAAFAYENYP